jgi:hypothetical protein
LGAPKVQLYGTFVSGLRQPPAIAVTPIAFVAATAAVVATVAAAIAVAIAATTVVSVAIAAISVTIAATAAIAVTVAIASATTFDVTAADDITFEDIFDKIVPDPAITAAESKGKKASAGLKLLEFTSEGMHGLELYDNTIKFHQMKNSNKEKQHMISNALACSPCTSLRDN